MGVPTFFRWLTLRCPKLLQDAIEDEDDEDLYQHFLNQDEQFSKNPVIDNLYLDMNGLIHPCTHPETKNIPEPTCEDDMFNNIFHYIDKIVGIVKPKKLLFLAIDGCAPRAKMNQQRGRRFRAASESAKILEKKKELKQLFLQKGIKPSILENFDQPKFDSNIITPGTPFMERMIKAVKEFIYSRLNNHFLYKDLIIILSDSNSPGEGEHKILEFIRKQRNSQDYNPNTRHCIYGADADLIMLGLSTHEPYFYIIRETIMAPSEKQCTLCGQNGHFFTECTQNTEMGQQQQQIQQPIKQITINFQFVKLFILREYLDSEFNTLQLGFQYNLERVCDDFVFLCFFVGNDFMPNFPCLTIRNGGIDCLLFIYKTLLPTIGGYITNTGNLDLIKLETFLQYLGKVEPALIEQQKSRAQQDKRNQERREQAANNNMNENPYGISSNKQAALQFKQQQQQQQQQKQPGKIILEDMYLEGNLEENFKLKLKQIIEDEKQVESKEFYSVQQENTLNLGEKGFKERYYQEKFSVDPMNFFEFQKSITQVYIEGLCWNYAYYYKGCISWNWFYPYHYAPFASDLAGISNIKVNLQLGQPFKPFEQLLAVLSPLSSSAIPDCFRHLMHDSRSKIIDFYPNGFHTDTKGKKYAWMGEVILPFIDEERLLNEIMKYSYHLNEEEIQRNQNIEYFLIYTNKNSDFCKSVCPTMDAQVQFQSKELTQKDHKIRGDLLFEPNQLQLNSKINISNKSYKLEETLINQVIIFKFHNIKESIVNPNLLDGVKLPELELNQFALQQADRKCFAGEKTIRIITRYLGIPNAHSYNPNQNINNEMVNRNHFVRNYQHNNFNEFYNNNRAMAREPVFYKSSQTLQKIISKEQTMNQPQQSKYQQEKNNFNISQQQFQQQMQQSQQNYQNTSNNQNRFNNFSFQQNTYFDKPDQSQNESPKKYEMSNIFENLNEYEENEQQPNNSYNNQNRNYQNKNYQNRYPQQNYRQNNYDNNYRNNKYNNQNNQYNQKNNQYNNQYQQGQQGQGYQKYNQNQQQFDKQDMSKYIQKRSSNQQIEYNRKRQF